MVTPCHEKTELFFETETEDEARRLCQGCAIQRTCLTGAVQRDEAFCRFGADRNKEAGVWGGATRTMLRAITLKTRRGRQPLQCSCGAEVEPIVAANRDRIICHTCLTAERKEQA